MEENTKILDKYKAKTTSKPTKPGCWNYLTVEIFQEETKIGEYERNYATLYNTFYPFELKGKEYALYSPSYTCTRIMSLPDCKDIGGEEPDGFGFCPTGFAVPVLHIRDMSAYTTDKQPRSPNCDTDKWCNKVNEDGYIRLYWPSDKEGKTELLQEYKDTLDKYKEEYKVWEEKHPYGKYPAEFGFICGCIWGDDGSWKIQCLDLSKADQGILVREEKLGYVELWGNAAELAQYIDTEFWEPDHQNINIGVIKRFNLKTGECYE